MAGSLDEARNTGHGAGGEVTHELGIINAVVLKVPVQALQGLPAQPECQAFPNSSLEVAGCPAG